MTRVEQRYDQLKAGVILRLDLGITGGHPSCEGITAFTCVTILWLFCFLFTSVVLEAQPQNATFRNLTSAEGLPTTTVTDITQDSHGFIWIGSWDWVYRYDGRTFKKFPIAGGRILEADQNGGVWISAEDAEVWYYDSYTDSLSAHHLDKDSHRRFVPVTVSENGMAWAATSTGVMKFNHTKGVFEQEQNQKKGAVWQIGETDKGELIFVVLDSLNNEFVGTRDHQGQYSYVPFPDKSVYPDYPWTFDFEITQFYLLAFKSNILIVNGHGWAILPEGQMEWQLGKPDDPEALEGIVHAILDNENYLWVKKRTSLSKIDLRTGGSEIYTGDPNKPKDLIGSVQGDLFIDRQGILWIAHFSTGISRLNLFDNDFGLVRESNGNPLADIISVLEVPDGSSWVGTRTFNGMVHVDPSGRIIENLTASSFSACPPGRSVGTELNHPFIWSLAMTDDGSIWAATGWPNPNDGGISRVLPGAKKIVRFKHDPMDDSSIPYNWVGDLKVDGRGKVWAYGHGGGVFIIDPETEEIDRQPLSESKTLSGLDEKQFYVNWITSEGDIILSHEQKNYLLDYETLEAERWGYMPENGELVNYEYEDKEGSYWFSLWKNELVGPTGVFGKWNPVTSEVEVYDDFIKVFPQGEIQALKGDEQGNLWMGTNIGIVRFDPQTRRLLPYEFDRGLQGNLFWQDVNHKGPSGKMYFGGNSGINIFHPDDIKENPYPPDMVFTNISLDGVPVAPGTDSPINEPVIVARQLTTGPDVTVVSIDFAALHFAGEGENRFQYQLEGFDGDWRDGENYGNATYTNLPHGDYTFRIKGSNWDGVWSDGSKSLQVIVLPPWYLTWWAYTLYGLMFVLGVLAVDRYQRKRLIRKERQKTQERELAQAREIEKAYNQLQDTQTQLIHSEKMASLGELTAGIAHEIQNPLNFVNNFSDVNKELVDELEQEIEKGDKEEIKALLQDLRENEAKVTHHGKRAEGIVKSMLQHSRGKEGQKEPTDINALCDEYLRLAYHGFRARDQSFNAEFKTELDPDLPKIEVVPQDIGRVLLNLINNAFQAIKGEEKPEVIVTTRSTPLLRGDKGGVQITISDNGPGIPDDIKDKIFQPFFTTKATGEGTGLGLSLSYDIVTKGHDGKLKVHSDDGRGSDFIIELPINH